MEITEKTSAWFKKIIEWFGLAEFFLLRLAVFVIFCIGLYMVVREILRQL